LFIDVVSQSSFAECDSDFSHDQVLNVTIVLLLLVLDLTSGSYQRLLQVSWVSNSLVRWWDGYRMLEL